MSISLTSHADTALSCFFSPAFFTEPDLAVRLQPLLRLQGAKLLKWKAA
jgi:hypothetical protein